MLHVLSLYFAIPPEFEMASTSVKLNELRMNTVEPNRWGDDWSFV